MLKVLYVKEGICSPIIRLAADVNPEDATIEDFYLLDRNNNAVRGYRFRDGEAHPVPVPAWGTGGQDLLVVGRTAAELLSTELGGLYAEDRSINEIKLVDVVDYHRPQLRIFQKAALYYSSLTGSSSPNRIDGVLGGSRLIVMPGNVSSISSWACSVGFAALDGELKYLGRSHVREDLKVITKRIQSPD